MKTISLQIRSDEYYSNVNELNVSHVTLPHSLIRAFRIDHLHMQPSNPPAEGVVSCVAAAALYFGTNTLPTGSLVDQILAIQSHTPFNPLIHVWYRME